MHRDLKSSNVFLTSGDNVKLGDFGMAKNLLYTQQNLQNFVGTPLYIPPEIINNHPYSYKADIWALGVIFYELLALNPPFIDYTFHGLLVKICNAPFTPLPDHYSQELRDFVMSLLERDPKNRPSIHELFESDFLLSALQRHSQELSVLKSWKSFTDLKITDVQLKNDFDQLRTYRFSNYGGSPRVSEIQTIYTNDKNAPKPSKFQNMKNNVLAPSLIGNDLSMCESGVGNNYSASLIHASNLSHDESQIIDDSPITRQINDNHTELQEEHMTTLAQNIRFSETTNIIITGGYGNSEFEKEQNVNPLISMLASNVQYLGQNSDSGCLSLNDFKYSISNNSSRAPTFSGVKHSQLNAEDSEQFRNSFRYVFHDLQALNSDDEEEDFKKGRPMFSNTEPLKTRKSRKKSKKSTKTSIFRLQPSQNNLVKLKTKEKLKKNDLLDIIFKKTTPKTETDFQTTEVISNLNKEKNFKISGSKTSSRGKVFGENQKSSQKILSNVSSSLNLTPLKRPLPLKSNTSMTRPAPKVFHREYSEAIESEVDETPKKSHRRLFNTSETSITGNKDSLTKRGPKASTNISPVEEFYGANPTSSTGYLPIIKPRSIQNLNRLQNVMSLKVEDDKKANLSSRFSKNAGIIHTAVKKFVVSYGLIQIEEYLHDEQKLLKLVKEHSENLIHLAKSRKSLIDLIRFNVMEIKSELF